MCPLFPAEIAFDCLLAGPIPPELGNLTALKYLYLDGNQLSGESVRQVPITFSTVIQGCMHVSAVDELVRLPVLI